MRKLILAGMLVFVLAFGFFAMKSGVGFPTKIHSFSELKSRKELTNTQLDSLTSLKSTTYASTQSALNDSIKRFKSTKSLYESTMDNKTEIEKERAIAGVSYDLSYLWVKLGKYATENRCDLTIEVFQNQETSPEENYTLCDFKFYITASYLDLIEFIEKISIDSELNFIPENLKMYTEYVDIQTDEYPNGVKITGPNAETGREEVSTVDATMLLLKTEFYKTSVPVNKNSLSRVENQLTVENSNSGGDTTSVYTTNESNETNNTTNNTMNTTNTSNTSNTTNSNNTTNTTN